MKAIAILRENVRRRRLASGWSQEAVAEAAAMMPKHYQDIEAGRRAGLRLTTVEKIARALRVDVWELFQPDRFPRPANRRGRTGPRIQR